MNELGLCRLHIRFGLMLADLLEWYKVHCVKQNGRGSCLHTGAGTAHGEELRVSNLITARWSLVFTGIHVHSCLIISHTISTFAQRRAFP